ncbi:hypothetical protein [Chryseobacterium nematophagum]|nr:hypothetical protein [Chryseobacterium nematophagum]
MQASIYTNNTMIMDCLQNIIQFKSLCPSSYNGRYVEDFVQVNSILLSHLVNENELSGKDYGNFMIEAACQSVLSDLYTSYGNIVLENVVENLVFSGHFNTLSMAGGGFSLRDMSGSTMTKMVIKSLKIKPLFDGHFTVILDDGKELKSFDFVAQNTVETTYVLDYETSSKILKVYVTDPSKEFSQINVTKKTCGSCSGVKYNVVLQPLKNKLPSNIYSTFIPDAFLLCDSSGFICKLLQSPVIKQAIIKAVAIQCGISVYERLLLSPRVNDSTMNINKQAAELYLNTLVGKYQEFVFGTNFASGISKANNIPLTELIKRNIKNFKDICISCNSNYQTSTVIF